MAKPAFALACWQGGYCCDTMTRFLALALYVLALLVVLSLDTAHAASSVGKNKTLAPLAYEPFNLGQIFAKGWMLAQLEAQHYGLVGNKWLGGEQVGVKHIDASDWLGSKERFNGLSEAYPYWANGAWPLAVLTNDKTLQDEIKSHFAYIFDQQVKNGKLGPKSQTNPWCTFRFLVVLTQYIDVTGDQQAVRSMFDFSFQLTKWLNAAPLDQHLWAYVRWTEILEAYQWLLNSKYADMGSDAEISAIDELFKLARSTGFDWPTWLESDAQHPFTKDVEHGWLPDNTEDADIMGSDKLKPHLDRQWSHGVNVAQASMIWALLYRETGDRTYLTRGRAAWEKLYKFHGTSLHTWTSDETLSGRGPNRGTETCVVVEMMHSAAQMFLHSGDPWYLDRAERIAYNGLPGAFFNGTMWALNYYQQTNKIDAMDGEPKCERGAQYGFGMVFECCVTNHGQGWPKFVASQWAFSGKSNTSTLALLQYFPSEMKGPIVLRDGTKIKTIEVKTQYPFKENIHIRVQEASKNFDMEVRVPGWCKNCTAEIANETHSLEAGSMYSIPIPAGDSDITLTFPLQIRVERREPYKVSPEQTLNARSVNVVRGPLVFALPIKYVFDHGASWDTSADLMPIGFPHAQNNYLLTNGTWRVALVEDISGDALKSVQVHLHEDIDDLFSKIPLGQGPFTEMFSPIQLSMKAAILNIEDWPNVAKGKRGNAITCLRGSTSLPEYTTGWAGLPPVSPVDARNKPLKTIVLIPYGATDLRISEFPTAANTRMQNT